MASYRKISEGGMEGWLREEIFHVLPHEFFHDPIAAVLPMDGKVLKESRIRWAGIFSLPNKQTIFLKRDRTKGWLESLKYLLLPSKARKEWFNANQSRKRNLPIPKPLGWLERIHRGFVKESYYLSEAVGSGVSFVDHCSKSVDPSLVGELAKTVKKIHLAGLFHKDLHAGNFLWDGEVFFLTDLHRAKITRRLSLSQRLWNLAHLFHSLRSAWGEDEQSEFTKVYFEGESFDPRSRENILPRIHTRMERLLRRQWQSRTKRCLKESTEFSLRKRKGICHYHRRDFPLEFLKKKVEEHLRLVKEKPSDLVKCSPEITVSILEYEGKKLSIKHYHPLNFWDRFKEHFRSTKGMKAWIAGNGLSVRGISSLKPLGLVERRNWSGLKESAFLMEVSDRGQELDRYILANLGDFRERRSLIRAFSKWLSHYHQLNLYHQDMKTCNLLISKAGEGWNFYLLDLEDVRLNGKVSEKELFKNFLQLNTSTPKTVTTSDRFRFFASYLKLNPIVKDRKSFLRHLIDESKRGELVYVAPWGVVTEKL